MSSSSSNRGTSTSSSMTFHDRLVLYTHTCERRYCVHFITFRSEFKCVSVCVWVCTRLCMFKQTYAHNAHREHMHTRTHARTYEMYSSSKHCQAISFECSSICFRMLLCLTLEIITNILSALVWLLLFLFFSFILFSLSWIYYHDYYCYMLFRLRCRRRRHFVVVAGAVAVVVAVVAAAAVLYIVHRLRYAL